MNPCRWIRDRFALTIAILAVCPSLMAQGWTEMMDGVAINSTGADVLPPSWITGEAHASSSPLDRNTVYTVMPWVREAMGRYPKGFLKQNIDAVCLLSTLNCYGQPYTGTSGAGRVYMVFDNTKAWTVSREWTTRRFHFFLCQLLQQTHPDAFDKNVWGAFNSPDFKYGGPGKGTESPDETLMQRGFISSYASTSLEADVSETAEYLFEGDPKLLESVKKYPALQKKFELLSQIYGQLYERAASDAQQQALNAEKDLRDTSEASGYDVSEINVIYGIRVDATGNAQHLPEDITRSPNTFWEKLPQEKRHVFLRWIKEAMSAYPPEFLQREIADICVVGKLTLGGLQFGGTMVGRTLIIACTNENHQHYLEAFHHEFLHLLMANHKNEFGFMAWYEAATPGFRYLGHGIEGLKANFSSSLDESLMDSGFVSKYATSSLDEDAACAAEFLLTGGPEFFEMVQKHPLMKKKIDVLIDFYHTLCPTMVIGPAR